MAKSARTAAPRGGYSFKGSGRTAAYRGAAKGALKAGKSVMQAHNAGKSADQAYSG